MDRKGLLTVEAAITIPVFICVIASIIFFIKIIYVQEIMQHAIAETANEISTYSYIYSISGIQELNDKTTEELGKSRAKLNEQTGTLIDTYDCFSAAGEILSNPKEELKLVAFAFAQSGVEGMKTELVLRPLARASLAKYIGNGSLEETDKRLKKLNVVDGFEGLDFSQSKLFEDKKNIDLIVKYKMKLILPISLMPELCFVQRVKVKAWLDGEDGDEKETTEENVWALRDLERGKRIQQIYGRNLPEYFKTITKFENGTATLVTSINLNAKTYQEDNRKVAYLINKAASDLAKFKSDRETVDKNGKSKEYYVDSKDIRERCLIVVIPKGTRTEKLEKIFGECTQKAKQSGVILSIEEL